MGMAFHTTDLYSPDLYTVDVLSTLLGEGNDSRLYTRLVKEKELLYNISSINYTPKYPGLFLITGIGSPDKMDEAREEVFRGIEDLATDKITPEEIERGRNMVMADYVRSHEEIKSVVSSMTSSEMLTGDASFYEKYVESQDIIFNF